MSRKLPQEDIQQASWSDARSTSTGSFQHEGAAATLSIFWMSELFALSDTEGNSFQLLLSMFSLFRSLPKAHDHSWGLECRLRALPSTSTLLLTHQSTSQPYSDPGHGTRLCKAVPFLNHILQVHFGWSRDVPRPDEKGSPSIVLWICPGVFSPRWKCLENFSTEEPPQQVPWNAKEVEKVLVQALLDAWTPCPKCYQISHLCPQSHSIGQNSWPKVSLNVENLTLRLNSLLLKPKRLLTVPYGWSSVPSSIWRYLKSFIRGTDSLPTWRDQSTISLCHDLNGLIWLMWGCPHEINLGYSFIGFFLKKKIASPIFVFLHNFYEVLLNSWFWTF